MKKILATMIALFLFSTSCIKDDDKDNGDQNVGDKNNPTTQITTGGGTTTTPVVVSDIFKTLSYIGTWKVQNSALTIFNNMVELKKTGTVAGSKYNGKPGAIEIWGGPKGFHLSGEFEIDDVEGEGTIELDYGTDTKRVGDYIVVKAKTSGPSTLTEIGSSPDPMGFSIALSEIGANKKMVMVFKTDPNDKSKLEIYINNTASLTDSQVDDLYNTTYKDAGSIQTALAGETLVELKQ